jgi:hypothetical protein
MAWAVVWAALCLDFEEALCVVIAVVLWTLQLWFCCRRQWLLL